MRIPLVSSKSDSCANEINNFFSYIYTHKKCFYFTLTNIKNISPRNRPAQYVQGIDSVTILWQAGKIRKNIKDIKKEKINGCSNKTPPLDDDVEDDNLIANISAYQ